MEAVIDLVKPVSVSSVRVHTLDQSQSQIWLPSSVELYTSVDGKNFTAAGTTNKLEKDDNGFNAGFYTITLSPVNVQYLKVVAKNHGIIATGNRFAGSHAGRNFEGLSRQTAAAESARQRNAAQTRGTELM